MLALLLSVALSKVVTFAVPLALCAAAGVLVFRGLGSWALIAAVGAVGWFATGAVYQEGVSACEARVDAATAAERQHWQTVLDAALEAASARAEASEQAAADWQEQVRQLEAERARLPAGQACEVPPAIGGQINAIR